jgi:hypothetical protein
MAAQDAVLAKRIAKALKTYSAFVFQKDLDDVNDVTRIMRELELTPLMNIVALPNGIYVVTLNTRPCNVECKLQKCRDVEEAMKKQCMGKCLDECKQKLLARVIEVLESYAGRRSSS